MRKYWKNSTLLSVKSICKAAFWEQLVGSNCWVVVMIPLLSRKSPSVVCRGLPTAGGLRKIATLAGCPWPPHKELCLCFQSLNISDLGQLQTLLFNHKPDKWLPSGFQPAGCNLGLILESGV